MSQTSVADEPVQAYPGKVENSGQFPTQNISRIASELIYFGKLAITADTDLAVGGAAGGPQECKLPTTAAEVLLAAQGGGVAIADPSIERLRDPLNLGVANSAPYGAFPHEDAVPLMRKGRVWVQLEAALAALSAGVFVRVSTPGTIPIASLGSFTPTNTVDHEPAPEGFSWAGSALGEGGIFLGLLDINLPG
jgi:hypothetical protein